MKKILLILGLTLFTIFAYSQKPKVSAVRYTDVTTTERDNYSVPAGEFWRIYNTTTTQNEYWDGDSWEALSISEATFNLNSKSYSWGESYIYNWRDLVLDDGATYFPNNGGYEKGRLHQLGIIPSLHLIPAAVKPTVLYSVGKNRTNDFTVDRASLATYIDEDRILRTAAFDFARIDYTDGDGAILAEPQSTNLALWSEDFTQWLGTRSSRVITSFPSPSNSLNGNSFIPNSGGNTKIVFSISTAVSGFYTASCFFAQKEYIYGGIRLSTDGGSNRITYLIDLTTGELSSQSSSGTPLNTSFKVELINGWYKLSVTAENTSGDVEIAITSSPVESPTYSSSLPTSTTDGTSGIYIWGGSLKKQSVPCSYIKTEGTTVTRLADEITGAGDVNTFNSLQGVFMVEMAALTDEPSSRRISILKSGDLTNVVFFLISNTTIRAIIDVGGVRVLDKTYNSPEITAQHECIILWEQDRFEFWVNGSKVGESLSGNTYGVDTLDELDFDAGNGAAPFYGKIKQLKYYKSISDAQKDFPYITNFFPLLLIGFRRRNQFKIAA